MPVIYVDVLFFVNFFINFLILYITNCIIKGEKNLIKLIIASVIGGVYGSAVFFIEMPSFFSWLLRIFISVAMVGISFGLKKFKNYLMFYLVAFIFCGVLTALLFNTSLAGTNSIISNGSMYFNISFGKLFITASICFGFLYSLVRISKEILLRSAVKGDIKITMGENIVKMPAILDTGNTLSLNGKYVIVVPPLDAFKEVICDLEVQYESVGIIGILSCFMADEVIVNNKVCQCILAIDSSGKIKKAIVNPMVLL